jgi:hypothetical protein
MDDDWEDFLGLDATGAASDNVTSDNDVVNTDNRNDVVVNNDGDDDAFNLPEQISPLSPCGEECLSSYTKTEEGFSFDTDFLSMTPTNEQESVHNSVTHNAIDNNNFVDNDNAMDFLSVNDNVTPGAELTASVENTGSDDITLDDTDTTENEVRVATPINEGLLSPSPKEDASSSAPDPDDFLSWLDDKKTSEVKTATDESSTPNTKLMMDSFFDEVFGDDESNPLSGKTVTASTKNYESQLRKEISSAFCDVNKIRNLILSAGYLPKALRGQVIDIHVNQHVISDQQ